MIRNIGTKKLNIYEIIVNSLKIYSKKIVIFLAITLLFNGMVLLIMETIPNQVMAAFSDTRYVLNLDFITIYSYVLLFVSIVFSSLAYGAITLTVMRGIEDRPVKIESLIESSLFRCWKLILTGVFYISIIYFFMPLILPSIYLGVIFIFCISVTAVSGKWGIAAFVESKNIVKGNFWHITLIATVLFLLSHIFSYATEFLISFFGITDTFFSRLCIGLLKEGFYNFMYVVIALCFFNLSSLKLMEARRRKT